MTGAASRVEAPAATAENGSSAAVRNKGAVTVQAHFHGDGFVTDEAQMSFIELTSKSSFDHVRILFSRFVVKTDPSAIAHWAISAFYEHHL